MNDIAESEELFNEEVEDIVDEIKGTFNNESIPKSERNRRVSVLLTEMEEYTQPLIQQIDGLNDYQKHLILCRTARLFPEIIQKEIKSVTKFKNKQPQRQQTANPESIQTEILHFDNDKNEEKIGDNNDNDNNKSNEEEEDLTKVLARLGYEDLRELYRHSKPSQIFGECINTDLQRKESEKATSNKVEKQLNEWRKQKEKKELETMAKMKKMKKNDNNKNDEIKPNKNNAKKVMMMMGVGNFENEDDIEAICKASTKALRKLV